MDPGTSSNNEAATKSEQEIRLTLREFIEIDNAIRRGDFTFLQKFVKGSDKKDDDVPRVNLSKDPLLNVIIAYGKKTELLALQLIKMMQPGNLMAKNEVGDTALHVAAAMDSLSVATALIDKNPNLIEERNNKFETPLLKAALFGSAATFRKLKRQNSDGVHHRTLTGASVLHCAILGNNPGTYVFATHAFIQLCF
ncbi:Caskin/Ankyrin repeat-containing protein [Dioscorea alata]|uniref:Caskin/Ankyrin repeat-containing protein n=1 Tax=Dioscorea alata TaxID=55571 RepID=A0ACB7WHR4_DIOAL|nr:Caskin/Ankyrin repeat-containing protein [Dioscorea alata]